MSVNELYANGMERQPENISPAAMQYVGQVALFGIERLADAYESMASLAEAEEFGAHIEQLCTAQDAESFMAVDSRTVYLDARKRSSPITLSWNPAGIVGQFGSRHEWDGAVASMSDVHQEKVWTVSEGSCMLRPHRAVEGIYIDRRSGLAMVQRAMWPVIGRGSSRIATKPATTAELTEAMSLLQPVLEHDKIVSEQYPERMPRYLEIGYGLDPSAVRGCRTFSHKYGVGLDRAVGNYVNSIGAYPDAVRSQTKEFVRNVRAEKPGQHISFVIGDATRLPFANGSIKEVFMSNVLNANLESSTRTAIIADSRRVLQASGALVLRANWHQDQWPQEKLMQLVETSGFWVVRSVTGAESEYNSLQKQYGTPTEVAAPIGYYVIAVPK